MAASEIVYLDVSQKHGDTTDDLDKEMDLDGLPAFPGEEDGMLDDQGEDFLGSPSEMAQGDSGASDEPDVVPRVDDEETNGCPVYGADEDDWDVDTLSRTDMEAEDSNRGLETADESSVWATTTAPAETQSTDSTPTPTADIRDGVLTQPLEGNSSSPGDIVGSERRQQESDTCDREKMFCSPPLTIKDEPIDDGYDDALAPTSSISRFKEELENELKISSVFSVGGNQSDLHSASTSSQPPLFPIGAHHGFIAPPVAQPPQPVLQPLLQSLPQPMPLLQPMATPLAQSLPPPAPVRASCSGCSKVLHKGQTAFQRKGSNQLFCSTVCLARFNFPQAATSFPMKACQLCLKTISNPKDLITVPVDSANTLKEFCSQACLSIFIAQSKDAGTDVKPRCSMCKRDNEIQHEVTHQGVLHHLCSDECFSRFRLSKRLTMSCCEICGSCNAMGVYHLLQIEGCIKRFCSPACIGTFKQRSRKKLHCPHCNAFKPMEQMMEGMNAQGISEFFCSLRCLTSSKASHCLSGASFPCTTCQTVAVPQYHLALADGSIRNFCTKDCVVKFQEGLNRTGLQGQMNVGSDGASSHGAAHPHHVPPHPNPANLPWPPGPPSTLEQPHQQPNGVSDAERPVQLTCKHCQRQFSSKPEVLQYKTCCESYKRTNNVTAVCEYCKQNKVVKDFVKYDHQMRPFCCEGCKLLFKHDLTKKNGRPCRVCTYCKNGTFRTLQNHFGGALEEFCTEQCMSLYTVLYYEMAKCDWCEAHGPLAETLRWNDVIKHFCKVQCVLRFCALNVQPDQPISSGAAPAATGSQGSASATSLVQTLPSRCRDVPSVGGVVSLSPTLPGQPQDPSCSAFTVTLSTPNGFSKVIGDASTQTDAMMLPPLQPRTLKNKALMCKPIIQEQEVQCDPVSPQINFHTVVEENGEKIKYVPVPIPIPMPVYIPLPMNLYSQFAPVPVGLPLPLPVPIVVPPSSNTKGRVPPQTSVEEEELDKDKDKSVSHGDQGSTYSGDLESEARSTPHSWVEDSAPPPRLSEAPREPDLPAPDPLHPEADLPLHKEPRFTGTARGRRRTRDGFPPRKRGRGRRRSATVGSSGMTLPPPSSMLQAEYGVKAWASWVQHTASQPASQHQCSESESAIAVKEDVLECNSEELSYGLCRFVKEARQPDGQPYTADSILYLCLSIQQSLFDNGKVENIFTDSIYSQFTTEITRLLRDWEQASPPGGLLQSRVEVEYLWQCKQLGAYSPIVLLNTLLFFSAKLLRLRTLEQLRGLAFSRVTRCSRTGRRGKTSYLRFRALEQENSTRPETEVPALPSKRKREDEDEDEGLEMPENTENPLRCPVRLYEFYLSKCSDTVKQRPDLFYLQPKPSCLPSSPVWYTAQPLEDTVLESMLTRLFAVRDLHVDTVLPPRPVTTDDDSSQ